MEDKTSTGALSFVIGVLVLVVTMIALIMITVGVKWSKLKPKENKILNLKI